MAQGQKEKEGQEKDFLFQLVVMSMCQKSVIVVLNKEITAVFCFSICFSLTF